MNASKRWLWLLLIATGFVLSARASFAQETPSVEAATLRYANRDIATFHSPLAGAAPPARAQHAAEELRELGDSGRLGAVSAKPFQYEGQSATAILVGERVVFALLPGDTQEEGRPLNEEAEVVRRNLESAFAADRAQHRPEVLLVGSGIALAATVVAWLFVLAARRGTGVMEAWLLRRMKRDEQHARLQWQDYVRPLLTRITVLLRWLIYFLVAYIWLAVVLEAFPLTRPLGDDLRRFFGDKLRDFGRAAIDATPGLVTVLLILLLTRAIAEGVGLFFKNVHEGHIRAPFFHQETASATNRLIKIVIWAMGVAVAYPFIPGSSSDAFKGVSVMLGLVLTLGSAGVVNQLMSGMVVVYSRALRRGDMVEVSGLEARVVEVGALATKLVNVNRQEITIPNSVLVGNSVHNYSKRAEFETIYLSVKVTIGYDAPWRQVHQILLDAVKATPRLSATTAPFVLQTSLDDFYVAYEVFAALEDPVANLPQKPEVMSNFHACVQDSFNSQDVQIMSPHFVAQPEQAIVVPKDKWFSGASPS